MRSNQKAPEPEFMAIETWMAQDPHRRAASQIVTIGPQDVEAIELHLAISCA